MNTKLDELAERMAHFATRRKALRNYAGGFAGLALASGLVGSWPADGASFLITGSLNEARAYHTATLLPNGKVLVAGGYYEDPGDHYLLQSEIYDPATGMWTATGDLNSRREAHTATMLSDGTVLVAGGDNDIDPALSQSELYDPASGRWTKTGALNTGRSDHTATLLANGKVLVAGGYGLTDGLSSAEIYDPATGKWTLTGSMAHARYLHTATLLSNGKALVAGGFDGDSLSSAELYDPATGTWTDTTPLNSGRDRHTATLLPNGKVLVAGGSTGTLYYESQASAELYDPPKGTWTLTGSMVTLTPSSPPGRFDHTANLLPSGQVLVIGGDAKGLFTTIWPLSDAELYDSVSGIWTAAGTLNTQRASHTATLLPSGKVLVAGGWYILFATLFPGSAELYVNTLTLTNATQLFNGSFQFSFTGNTGDLFSVLATTNLMLPISNWTVLNGVTETSPGQFQFTDTQATNHPRRFYRLRSP